MKNLLISLFFILPLSASSQCQQYVFSTVPATEWSTWTYVNCVTLDTTTLNIPCCGYTAPRCAVLGSPTLIDGDGFFAALTTPLGEPWEDCEQYNEEPCIGDINEDGFISVLDLLMYLTEPNVGEGDLEGVIQNFGNQCD